MLTSFKTSSPAVLAVVAALLAVLGVAAVAGAATQKFDDDDPRTYPECFGAAARDTSAPCRNPALRLAVLPKPVDAELELNSPCQLVRAPGGLNLCRFGTPAERATRHVALIGDSHAAHWRAALDVVVAARSWEGTSSTRVGCPYSTSRPIFDERSTTRDCLRWRSLMRRWLLEHPDVDTLVVSQHRVRVRTRRGRGQFEEAVQGYKEAWRRLPASVKHVVVIHDTPRVKHTTRGCIERAMRRRTPAGPSCALRRGWSLRRDPAVIAARTFGSPRVQAVDLSSFMCSSRLCLPVVGGALVHKDTTHITRVFGTTLGPYLNREIDRLAAGWEPDPRAPAPAPPQP